MPQEQTFRSPNFYDREIDRSAITPQPPVGVPAGVIGTANRGPAFVPVSFGNFDEFKDIFGDLDSKKYGPYAVNEWMKNRSAGTYLRVLGAGANSTESDIATSQLSGRVKNAGFKMTGNDAGDETGRHNGSVQFLVAQHELQTNEAFGFPLFTDNNSFGVSNATMVRGIVMLASGARMMVLDGDESAVGAFTSGGPDDAATVSSGKFKLVISSTLGNEYTNTDGNAGVKIFTASLDPTSTDYFGKLLNQDPDRFVQDQHFLYADFAVDAELAAATLVGTLSGSNETSDVSAESSTTMREVFGAYDTRYTVPSSPMFISQPFGDTEYDLFRFEALDDGEFANKLYKIAITNIKASVDESDPFGTFTVEIRDWNDTDTNPNVLERFPNCSLNPTSPNYVAKLIGDRRVTFNFDAVLETERRVVATGKYPNVSRKVRIVVSDAVEREMVPQECLPFGFRGIEALKTNDSLTDTPQSLSRLTGVFDDHSAGALSGSIIPPVPFRYKVTRGEIPTTSAWAGQPGPTELATPNYYWGVKFERNTLPLNSNLSSEKNNLLSSLTKFFGIKKLDALLTGSGADEINNNKFSLSKVALSNGAIAHLTASVRDHMKEAAYIRDAVVDPTNYTINDATLGTRVTLASILANDTAANFNRFSQFNKFITFMGGGYDGLNFLDRDARRMNDKSTSFAAGGGAESSYVSPGFLVNQNGSGQNNSNVVSYKTAVNIMTDPLVVNHNILAVPGIREDFLTEYTTDRIRDYGLAYYVLDLPGYSDSTVRLYDNDLERPDVDRTVSKFESRVIDNNFAGTYFPSVYIDDDTNKRRVKVPGSIAAMGALGFNDRVAYPWFAPAGFNRAALDFVKNVEVRLNSTDRNRLYEARINPIATFPKQGYAIFGQKTLQIRSSALDRVNVRRLLVEVKRIVLDIARRLVFEQNTQALRNQFNSDATIRLGLIQAQAGIEGFKVVMNETNNTQEDNDLNRLNGKIVVIPTRTIENIFVDFIITNAGVQFV